MIFYIEMWDIDTRHPFLYVEDDEVQTFDSREDAQRTVSYLLDKDGMDFMYDYHITTNPSEFAKPLPKKEF